MPTMAGQGLKGSLAYFHNSRKEIKTI